MSDDSQDQGTFGAGAGSEGSALDANDGPEPPAIDAIPNKMATIYTRFFSISDDPLKKIPKQEQLLEDVPDLENESPEEKAARVGDMSCDEFFKDGCDPELKTDARGTTDVGLPCSSLGWQLITTRSNRHKRNLLPLSLS